VAGGGGGGFFLQLVAAKITTAMHTSPNVLPALCLRTSFTSLIGNFLSTVTADLR